MIKKNLKTMIITSVLILAPILIGVIYWNQLPAEMATHFDANGDANGWTPKEFAVFGLPALLLAVHWLCVAFTGEDPKYENITKQWKTLIFWICPVISIIGCGSTYLYSLGYEINTTQLAYPLLGIIFVVIGNYMPKARQSYTVGIKLPWTLNSETNWNRTHRLAGYTYMLGGIIILIAGFVQQFWLGIVAIAFASLVPTVYSYLLYKKGV